MKFNKIQTVWLYLSIVLTVAGAVLLYPIGSLPLNVLFVLIKIGMLVGLSLLLFAKKSVGLPIWAAFSLGAVVMTCLKSAALGQLSPLFVISIIVDIGMPAGAFSLMRRIR